MSRELRQPLLLHVDRFRLLKNQDATATPPR